MTRNLVPIAALLVSACGLSACGGNARPATAQRYQITLNAKNDDGDALEGVRFTTGKQALGVTSGSGTLAVTLTGSEGQTIPIEAKCPAGYNAPDKVPSLRLATTRAIRSNGPQPLTFDVMCTRTVRDVVVVVHATRGAGLPVTIEGQPRAVTDGDGNAHVLLELERDVRSVTVALDTSARKRLKPVSPQRVFELDGRDAILLFAQDFSEPARHRVRRSRPKPSRHIPYRLN